ncbi:C2 family cysteine protease [Allosalinactinospora lopnorensis]|uniref:C2 family cysteine protease n=1 Tax=Allosalinactinospora lopnorensis TaxID=1352348 RepID=UPI000623FA3D|nr:C2 family cysteine protease [Allosalinactinospora lopnorensis]
MRIPRFHRPALTLWHPSSPDAKKGEGEQSRFGPSTDRGASFAEYAAVIILVAAIAVGVITTGVGGRITNLIHSAVCSIAETSGCEDTTPNGDSAQAPAPSGEQEIDNTSPPIPDGYPAPQDFEDARDSNDEIREYLDKGGSHWWNPWSWGNPDHPKDIMAGMSADELNALMWSLSPDEIRELLREDGVREIVLSQVNLDTLRRLRQIDPAGIDPDFSDVGGDDANEDDGNPNDDLGWGQVLDGTLWGEDGHQISSDDIEQGGLGDCWWLAGMGAIADQDPGFIQNMITENPNGTYTVTFPDTGENVTVTPDIVVGEDGTAAFSDPQNNVMWPVILEKAYAEREGSFGEIEGGWPKDAMETITGNSSERHDSEDVSEAQLNEWLTGGTAVTITTTGDKEGDFYEREPHENGLARNHAYIVTNVSNGRVRLYNTWGHSHVTMTVEEFNQQLDTVETNSLD